MNINEIMAYITDSNDLAGRLSAACAVGDTAAYIERLRALCGEFAAFAPSLDEVRLYSAPGRTEIGGNHTDHQKGCVLAAAVDLDAVAAAAPNGTDVVSIRSAGYDDFFVKLDETAPVPEEAGSPAAIVRGIAAALGQLGHEVHGFTACVSSNVPAGSGLSSSACFEVLIGTIMNDLFCGGALDAITIARAGQFAENKYAMKPSGLLDQATTAVGGLVSMDFSRGEPVLGSIEFSFERHGYALCVVNTGGSHVSLTADYAAITDEMRAVAGHFGKSVLSEVGEDEFYSDIAALRESCGDRAVLRAMHYFDETKRALAQAQALCDDDIEHFLALVNASGRSSELLLQNIFPVAEPSAQGVTLGLALARRVLSGRGAYRVHGGGFAGTIQAYVPLDVLERFTASMEAVFGGCCCLRLSVRPSGGVRLA